VTGLAIKKNEVPLETSIPDGGVTLESILCTEELQRRPSRPPDHKKENCALVALVSALADSPRTILQTMAETILEITQSDSAGLSVLTKDDGKRFYWPAIAGVWSPHVGGGTPRNFGPCGDVLDRNCTLLFRHFERRYPYLLPVIPAAEECLLVPFYVGGKAVGTIWAIMHSDRRKFDAEDERVMASLGKFASSTYQALESIHDLKFQVAEREKAERELRGLNDGLEKQVRVRTEELEQRSKQAEEREAKIRRLVDANIIGIFTWNLEGKILEANDAFLRMVEYNRDDLLAGRMRWADLTPAEWQERAARATAELKETGRVQTYEKEFFRKDGSRVPVLVGGASFEAGGNEGVAFVLDLSEQKRSEELYRIVVETASDAVITADDSGLILFTNPATQRIFGYDSTELIGRPLTTLMPEFMRKLHEAGFKRYLATGQRHINWQGTELIGMRKNGEEFPLEISFGEQIRNGHRVFTGFVRDISEKKRAEEALRRSEAYLEEAQRLSHTGSLGWDVSNGEIYWSAETFRIFEYQPTSKVTIEMVLQRTHPEDRLAVQQLIERVARERKEWDFEHRLLMPDGSIKYLQVVGRPSTEGGGHFELVGAVTDVSDRKRAETDLQQTGQQLTAQGAQLHELFEQAPEGVVLLDVDDRILRINREFIRMFGYTRDEAIGRPINELIAPGELRGEAEEYTHRLTNRGETLNVETVRARKDGSHFPVSIIGVPVSIAGSQIVEYAIFRDISERKRAEEERERLRQAQSDLSHINRVSTMGELTASLGHEIKQPISAAMTDAKTCLRWLDRDQPEVAKAREAASRLIKDVTRANEIIGRIGSLFKKHVPKRELIDVNELIREMIVLMRSEASRYSISIHDELADGLPKIMADRVGLQQVLMNLMLNGVEAMRDMIAPGALTIVSRRSEDGQLAVSIHDTGVGVSPERIDQIFSAFVTSKPQGTGMGLPISRSIIESHGGRLWATCNPGSGATFQFTLPLETAARLTA